MLKRIIVIVALAAVLVALLLYSQRSPNGFKVSGFIEADEIRVGSRVGGRVDKVFVEEGDRVERGTVLLTLEPFDLLEQKTHAEATLAQRQAELEKLTAGYREEEVRKAKANVEAFEARLTKLKNGPRPEEIVAAEREVDESQARLELATARLRRIETLVGRNAATQEELDQATSEVRATRATLDVRKQNLKILQEGTRVEEIAEGEAQLRESQAQLDLLTRGFRTEEIAEARAAVEAASALLHAIEQQVKELTIVAPVDSVVQAVDLEPGDLVGANVPAISLVDTSHLWVRSYVPENRLNLRSGQPLRVTIDSFPGKSFEGQITFVSQQAEFTPRNVQTPEERSKQVFRIKVTLVGEVEGLRPGMSADVWFDGTTG